MMFSLNCEQMVWLTHQQTALGMEIFEDELTVINPALIV